MNALKPFKKPFQAAQRSEKIKISKLIAILMQLSETQGAGRVNTQFYMTGEPSSISKHISKLIKIIFAVHDDYEL